MPGRYAADPFHRWSLHTITRLIRRVIADYPHINALDWARRHHHDDQPAPGPDHEIDPGELWSVELHHLLYQQLIAEYPGLVRELAHLSFREALRFVYAYEYDS